MQSFTILLAKIYVLQVAPEQHPDTAVFTTGTGSPSEKRSTLGPWGTAPGAPGLSGAVYHRERGSAVAEGREPPGCSGVPQPTRPGKYCPHQDDPCPQRSLTAAGWARVISRSVRSSSPTLQQPQGQTGATSLKQERQKEEKRSQPYSASSDLQCSGAPPTQLC